jgi:phage terminase large subunit
MQIDLPILYGENLKAYKCHDPEVMLAGPADTGKTITLLTKLHWIAHHYQNASIVIARKQQTDTYSTVLESFEDKILQGDPTIDPYGGEKPQWYDYPSGSRIWVTGLDKSGKVLSGEHDIIYVNQAEEISVADWETLTTRTTGRAGHIPYPQTIGDCNPGPPQHWIKQRARQGHLTFFESTHRDNPDLFNQKTGEQTQEGIARIGNLKRLTGSRYARLYLGLWAAPEGMIYEHFDEDLHKIKSVDLPTFWPRFIGIDPVGAQIAAVWVAFDPQNQVLHVYREYMQPFGVTTPQHMQHIQNMSRGEMIMAWAGGGPSERQQRLDWGGLEEPGIVDVWSGIDKVNSLLKDRALLIHDCCVNLLSEIGEYQRVIGKNGLATDKILNKEKYHMLDSLRYVVAFLSHPREQVEVIGDLVPIGREF